MKKNVFFNLVLVMSFILSSPGMVSPSLDRSSNTATSVNFKMVLEKIDAWMDGLKVVRFETGTNLIDIPGVTPTPGLGTSPTEEPTPSPTLVPTESPTPEPTIAITQTLIPTPDPELLLAALDVDLEPDPAAPGDVVTATWTIQNFRGGWEGVEIWLYLPEAFVPLELGDGTFDPEMNLLILPIREASGLFSWYIDGSAQPPYDIRVEVHVNGQVVLSVQRSLGKRGPDFIPMEGGEAHGFNRKVKVNFPPGALPEAADVQVEAPANTELSLGGQPMELTATGRVSGMEITQFSQPVTITVQYTDEEAATQLEHAGMKDESSLTLFYYNEAMNTWRPLTTIVDTEANQLTAVSEHFTLFDYKAQNWEAARLPSMEAFQVSGFTGAGTYSFPIQVPPGPGGLQPSLALSHNTQVIDSASSRTQAAWVGMGWSLDTGYIQRSMNGTPNYFDDDTFSLEVNGVGGMLLPIADQDGDANTNDFHFADERFWRVRQYLATGNVGGYQGDTGYWVVWDPSGTQFYFGNYSGGSTDGHAWYPSYPITCAQTYMQTWRWSMTRVRNIFGKELTYNYYNEYAAVPKFGYGCPPGYNAGMAVAVYPASIVYPNNHYRVVFVRETSNGLGTRLDYDTAWNDAQSTVLYMRSKLLRIEIWHDPNGNWSSGDEVLIRKYVLGYGENDQQLFPGVTWPATGKTLTLTSITEYGLNGTNALPATTFTYFNMHLNFAQNGYGGRVSYGYSEWHAVEGSETVSCGYIYGVINGIVDIMASYPLCHDFHDLFPSYFNPGGAYTLKVMARRAGGTQITLGFNNGAGDTLAPEQTIPAGQSYTERIFQVVIPATASQARPVLSCDGCEINGYTITPVVTRYRVISRTLTDEVTNESRSYSYAYTGPKVNDTTTSQYVVNDPDGYHLMSKPNSEFRGHSQVTETDPDGRVVETLYYQDDCYRGQAYQTTIKDSQGNIYTRSITSFAPQEFPTYNLPHPQGQQTDFYHDLEIWWAYTTTEENRSYNGDTSYVASRNEYQYLTSDQGGNQYGNRTRTITSAWIGNNWEAYRGSITGYSPKVSNGYGVPADARYLTGLQAYQNSYACPAGCDWQLADLLSAYKWLYDNHTDYATPPDNGVLTGGRNLVKYLTPPRTDPRYADTKYTYDDGWGNRTSVTQYTGETEPNSFGLGSGAQTTYTCYGGGGSLNNHPCSDDGYYTYPLWERNALDQPTTFVYDKTKSVPTSLTDTNDAVTTATYDEFGRILTIVRPGDSTSYPTAVMSYHTASEPFMDNPFWTEAQQRITGSTYFKIRKYYSGLGQLLQNQVVGATIGTNTKDILTDTFYDAGGRVFQQTVPYEMNPGMNYHPRSTTVAHTEISYDVLGRTLTSLATDGTPTSYLYWDGTVNGYPSQYSKVTNPRTYYTTTKSDMWGRAVLVTPPTGPTVSYAYDEADRLQTTTRGGLTTTLTYDFGGRKTSMNDPDMGLWGYTYDALSNLKTQTAARGCITTLAYDTLNRQTGKTYSGTCSETAVAYTYDSGTNGKGRRTGMTDGSGSTSWTYDNRGRLTLESKVITGSGSFKTQWTYNSADLISSMTYPGDNNNNDTFAGEVENYTYLNQMLLDTVSGTSTYVYNTDYDAAGRVELRNIGADVLRTDYVYYAWNTQGGRLQYLKTGTPNNATSMQNFTYTYDENGNVKTILDAKNSNQKQCFLYDTLDRLARGTTQLSDAFCQATHVGNGQYDESYAYNGTTGNLSSKGGQALSYGDTNHKHAATAWNGWIYTYDANGNMRTRTYGGTTYTLTYDAENHLTGMTGGSVNASFTYDGDGSRVKGIIGGVTTAYVGNYAEWISGSPGTLVKYYYAGITRVAMRSGSNNPLWLLGDHLGSTSKVANFDGLSIHSQQLYKPWGEKRYPTGAPTLPTTYRYTGQRSETGLGPSGGDGLMFYSSRWYDPALGRFVQPDTIIPQQQGVQAWDRYAYVNNSPINYTDPSGHCLILCTAIIGGAIGAIVGAVGYTAYTIATGREFNTGHMLLAAGGGASAGALIGTGVGIAAGMSAAAATTAAVTGAGTAPIITTTVLNATGGDPSDEINTATQAFGNLSQAANYGIQQGNQLKNALSGTGLQVHHLVEQRLAPAIGQSAAQAREWLSAAVTPQEHQVFTNAWRSAIGYSNQAMEWTTNNVGPTIIWEKAQRIYADYPALLDAAKKTIFGE